MQNISIPMVRLYEQDIKSLVKEIDYCQRAQSWARGPTRTGWYPLLEDILRAAEMDIPGLGSGYVHDSLIEVADDEAQRLAAIIAKEMAEDYDAIEALEGEDSPNDARDGYYFHVDGAVRAWASVRTWQYDAMPDTVEEVCERFEEEES